MAKPKLPTAALLAALTSLPLAAAAPDAGGPEPIRLSTDAFGRRARVEVQDLPAGANQEAASAALEEILRVEGLTDPLGTPARAPEGSEIHGVARLNDHAGQGPQPVDGALLEVLAKAHDFCVWSKGANGPLGGRLYELWGLYGPAAAQPTPEDLAGAVRSASCDHLRIDQEADAVTLAPGSRLDLSGFAAGWAVDRAVAVLQEHGAGNGYVEVGAVRRGFGAGPGGQGWKVTLPVFAGSTRPLGEIWLRDRSLALAHFEDRELEIAGDRFPPYLNLRSGQPAGGVVAVIAISELALEAQGLATTMFVTGNRQGQFLLGQLRPLPAVRWLLGSGDVMPLITDYNWSDTRLRR